MTIKQDAQDILDIKIPAKLEPKPGGSFQIISVNLSHMQFDDSNKNQATEILTNFISGLKNLSEGLPLTNQQKMLLVNSHKVFGAIISNLVSEREDLIEGILMGSEQVEKNEVDFSFSVLKKKLQRQGVDSDNIPNTPNVRHYVNGFVSRHIREQREAKLKLANMIKESTIPELEGAVEKLDRIVSHVSKSMVEQRR